MFYIFIMSLIINLFKVSLMILMNFSAKHNVEQRCKKRKMFL